MKLTSVTPIDVNALRPGQIVVTEGSHSYWLSRIIAAESDWWWTHAFIMIGPTEAVEATFPRVRRFDGKLRVAAYLGVRNVVVLDRPDLTDAQRAQIAAKAASYVGRWYNWFALLWYVVFRTFMRAGGGRTFWCSRLVTASYREGAGIDLTAVPIDPLYERCTAMRDGYVTPAELVNHLSEHSPPMSVP